MENLARNSAAVDGRPSLRSLLLKLAFFTGLAALCVVTLKRDGFDVLRDAVTTIGLVTLLALQLRDLWLETRTRRLPGKGRPILERIQMVDNEPHAETVTTNEETSRWRQWVSGFAFVVIGIALAGWPISNSPVSGVSDIDFRLVAALVAIAVLAALTVFPRFREGTR